MAGSVDAAKRAQWLAELAEAIDQAQRVAWALGDSPAASAQAMALYARLESVRSELDGLRRGRWQGEASKVGPLRSELFPDGNDDAIF